MEKLKMQSKNLLENNIEFLKKLFPNIVSETYDDKKQLTKKIDFELLKQELSEYLIETEKERFGLNWPGRKQAIKIANEPIIKTLRPNKIESVHFENTKNMYIEGDNLDVLKCLQESYLGKIKLIYIDPPYNTGKDFIYKDNFNGDLENHLIESGQLNESGKLVTNSESNGRFHSDWLTMMYSRLKISRNLLKKDGVIFISIGEDEVFNLEQICNQVFGENNKIGFISRVQKKGSDKGTYFKPSLDYILVYARNKNSIEGFRTGVDESKFVEIETVGERKGEKYECSKSLYQSSLDSRPNQRYYIKCPDGSFVIPPGNIFPSEIEDGAKIKPLNNDDKVWRWERDSYLQKKDLLVFKKTTSSPLINEHGVQSEWNVYTKRYLLDAQAKGNVPSNLFDSFYNSLGTSSLKSLELDFSFAKPIELIKFIFEITKIDNEFVLDFFSGSGTTAEAIMEFNVERNLNNKFILAQIPELIDENSGAKRSQFSNICELAKERIRRAGAKILEENKNKQGIENLDIGFRVFKVDSSNMKDVYYNPDEIRQDNLFDMVSNIKEDRTDLDLLFQVLLDSGVELTLPIEEKQIAGKKVYFVDGNVLAACFEDNLTEEFVTELAKCQDLLKVVFRDSSFGSDDSRINVEQIFKQYSPDTQIRVI